MVNPHYGDKVVEPTRVMATIAQSRAIFHSEADLQHAFAWELHHLEPDWDVRLEVPVRTSLGSIYLDLLARSQTGEEVAIELKYKTCALNVDVRGEFFSLMNQAAQDIGRYDFFKDLSRVEAFAKGNPNRAGYAVFLTNDSAYWKTPISSNHGYAEFAMNDGRNVSGNLCWGQSASEGTRKGRQDAIKVGGNYTLKWCPFSVLPVKAYGEFRYLCVRTDAD